MFKLLVKYLLFVAAIEVLISSFVMFFIGLLGLTFSVVDLLFMVWGALSRGGITGYNTMLILKIILLLALLFIVYKVGAIGGMGTFSSVVKLGKLYVGGGKKLFNAGTGFNAKRLTGKLASKQYRHQALKFAKRVGRRGGKFNTATRALYALDDMGATDKVIEAGNKGKAAMRNASKFKDKKKKEDQRRLERRDARSRELEEEKKEEVIQKMAKRIQKNKGISEDAAREEAEKEYEKDGFRSRRRQSRVAAEGKKKADREEFGSTEEAKFAEQRVGGRIRDNLGAKMQSVRAVADPSQWGSSYNSMREFMRDSLSDQSADEENPKAEETAEDLENVSTYARKTGENSDKMAGDNITNNNIQQSKNNTFNVEGGRANTSGEGADREMIGGKNLPDVDDGVAVGAAVKDASSARRAKSTSPGLPQGSRDADDLVKKRSEETAERENGPLSEEEQRNEELSESAKLTVSGSTGREHGLDAKLPGESPKSERSIRNETTTAEAKDERFVDIEQPENVEYTSAVGEVDNSLPALGEVKLESNNGEVKTIPAPGTKEFEDFINDSANTEELVDQGLIKQAEIEELRTQHSHTLDENGGRYAPVSAPTEQRIENDIRSATGESGEGTINSSTQTTSNESAVNPSTQTVSSERSVQQESRQTQQQPENRVSEESISTSETSASAPIDQFTSADGEGESGISGGLSNEDVMQSILNPQRGEPERVSAPTQQHQEQQRQREMPQSMPDNSAPEDAAPRVGVNTNSDPIQEALSRFGDTMPEEASLVSDRVYDAFGGSVLGSVVNEDGNISMSAGHSENYVSPRPSAEEFFIQGTGVNDRDSFNEMIGNAINSYTQEVIRRDADSIDISRADISSGLAASIVGEVVRRKEEKLGRPLTAREKDAESNLRAGMRSTLDNDKALMNRVLGKILDAQDLNEETEIDEEIPNLRETGNTGSTGDRLRALWDTEEEG